MLGVVGLVAVVAVSVPAADDPPRVAELTRQDRSAAFPNPDRIQITVDFITAIRVKKKNGLYYKWHQRGVTAAALTCIANPNTVGNHRSSCPRPVAPHPGKVNYA